METRRSGLQWSVVLQCRTDRAGILAGEDVGYDLIGYGLPGGCIVVPGIRCPKGGKSERRRQCCWILTAHRVFALPGQPGCTAVVPDVYREPDATRPTTASYHLPRSIRCPMTTYGHGSHTAATVHYVLSELAICVCDTCVRNVRTRCTDICSGCFASPPRQQSPRSKHRCGGGHESGIHITLNRRRIPNPSSARCSVDWPVTRHGIESRRTDTAVEAILRQGADEERRGDACVNSTGAGDLPSVSCPTCLLRSRCVAPEAYPFSVLHRLEIAPGLPHALCPCAVTRWTAGLCCGSRGPLNSVWSVSCPA